MHFFGDSNNFSFAILYKYDPINTQSMEFIVRSIWASVRCNYQSSTLICVGLVILAMQDQSITFSRNVCKWWTYLKCLTNWKKKLEWLSRSNWKTEISHNNIQSDRFGLFVLTSMHPTHSSITWTYKMHINNKCRPDKCIVCMPIQYEFFMWKGGEERGEGNRDCPLHPHIVNGKQFRIEHKNWNSWYHTQRV